MASSHTIKVTGVSDELLSLLDERIKDQHSTGRAEYIRELIRRDVLSAQENRGPSPEQPFREMLAPVHAEARLQEYTEGEIDDLVEEVRDEVYQEKQTESFR
jgi:metal-responsive CopG/Arc/MetJ family transcriptional regulator